MTGIQSSDNGPQQPFYEKANRHISSLNIKFQEKAIITRVTSEKIIECLQNNLT